MGLLPVTPVRVKRWGAEVPSAVTALGTVVASGFKLLATVLLPILQTWQLHRIAILKTFLLPLQKNVGKLP